MTSALDALSSSDSKSAVPPASKVFIIGGAEIYAEALRHLSASRVLLTIVYPPDETALSLDTYLPDFRKSEDWKLASPEDLRKYILEEVQSEEAVSLLPKVGERIKEKGYEYEFTLWERSQKYFTS